MLSENSSSKMFRLLAWLLIIAQSGCAMHPPSPDIHKRLQKQSIAYISLEPKIPVNLDLETKSRTEGFLKKGGLGAIRAISRSSCTGELCGVFLLSTLALGFIAGGIYGAVVATPKERAKDMEAAVNKGVSSIAVQLGLSHKILEGLAQHGRTNLDLIQDTALTNTRTQKENDLWRDLRGKGYSFLLETQITHFEFIGGEGRDPEIFFHLGVQVTLVDLENAKKAFEEVFSHVSEKKRFSQWTSSDSKTFKDLLQRNIDALASEITDKLFLQAETPISPGMWRFPGTEGYGCCWLCPISPPYEFNFSTLSLKYPVMDSLTPLLEWEAAEKRLKQNLSDERAEPDRKVTYDLRIWESFKDKKYGLVYEQLSLDKPKHKVQKPLKRRYKYFWSFRACFSQDNYRTCSPWASSQLPSNTPPALINFDFCGSTVIQEQNYYRFQTPGR